MGPKPEQLVSDRSLDLIVLAVRTRSLLCRIPGSDTLVTLRTAVRDEVPGEIVTVLPSKQWTLGHRQQLSGKVQGSRLDIPALGLAPLALESWDEWDPEEELGDEPTPDWLVPIVRRGPRLMFEMEQVIPGEDPNDPWDDPITEAADLHQAGAIVEARELLMSLTAADLLCVDAHAHLGNLEFDHRPSQALRHYAVGIAIGAAALGDDFDGVLDWGLINNRPYLRCLHGYALSLWRLVEMDTAAAVFERMLWLNPADNQGARINLADVRAGRSWSP